MEKRVLFMMICVLATFAASLGAQVVGDFDADRKADTWVYRPPSGTWFWLKSSTSNQQYDYKGWGLQAQGDLPVVGDFDGDELIDPTVYRPAAGTWFILKSSSNFTQWTYFGWGQPGDITVPGDYDGDSVTDACVFRPATGVWYVRPSAHPEAAWSVGFGRGGDVPVAADYDGDHRTDVAVYRPSTGTWFVLKSSSGFKEMFYRGWGANADVPVPGDYDGDGKADLAVYRPVGGGWMVLKSSASYQDWSYAGWGDVGDLPAPGDFDGDGRQDYVVFRPSTGMWYVRTSNETLQWSLVFGKEGDLPLGRPLTRVISLGGDLAFGGVQVGTTATRTLTISNSGNSSLAVTSVGYPTAFSGSWSGTIAAGGAQSVTVTFAPTGATAYGGTITVNANHTSGANAIAASGTGFNNVQFGPGQYRVNIDIPPGRYYSDPAYGCYWERQRGFGGTLDDIIANEFIGFDAGQWIVDINSTDLAFLTDADCGTWFNSPRRGAQPNISPGMWLVGSQINPGTYSAATNPGCYWERLRGFSGALGDILANDYVANGGSRLVSVRGSDVGFSTDEDCGPWTPTSGSSLTTSTSESVASQSQSKADIEHNREMNRSQSGAPTIRRR